MCRRDYLKKSICLYTYNIRTHNCVLVKFPSNLFLKKLHVYTHHPYIYFTYFMYNKVALFDFSFTQQQQQQKCSPHTTAKCKKENPPPSDCQ